MAPRKRCELWRSAYAARKADTQGDRQPQVDSDPLIAKLRLRNDRRLDATGRRSPAMVADVLPAPSGRPRQAGRPHRPGRRPPPRGVFIPLPRGPHLPPRQYPRRVWAISGTARLDQSQIE
jgi:hypothetical protein